MAFENSAGLGVHNHYGPRDVGTTVGVEQSSDSVHQLSIAFTARSLQDTFLPPLFVLRGMLFKRAVLRVDEVFTFSGVTPTIQFGSAGSVATNGVTLTAVELGTVGTKTPASTGSGTWSQTSATGVTANARVGVQLGGTDPEIVGNTGAATLTLEFFYKAKK